MGKTKDFIGLACFAFIFCFRAVAADETNDFGAYYKLTNQGAVELQSGQYDKAISDFSKVIEMYPTNCYAYLNRAEAYSANCENEKAIADYDRFISMNSTNSFAFIARANEFGMVGKYEKAVADLDVGINLDARNAHAFTLRGFCFEKLGRYADAGNDFSNAVQLDFSFVDAWNDLAWLRATCPQAEIRNGHEAVGAAIKACNLSDWRNWMYLDTLAVAYAETGDFELAVKYENKALELIDPQNKEMGGMQKRLLMFQQKQPYRDDPSH